jgi:uridine nucleosidase
VCDPEAADSLFCNRELAAKTTMIPLDVTHQVLATPEIQNMLLYGAGSDINGRKEPTVLRRMLVELLTFFAHTYADIFGITGGPPLHDPLAVAAVLDDIGEYEIPFDDSEPHAGLDRARYEVAIVTNGTHEQALRGETETGRTCVHLLGRGDEGVKIPRGLDVARFWSVMEECVRRADYFNIGLGDRHRT